MRLLITTLTVLCGLFTLSSCQQSAPGPEKGVPLQLAQQRKFQLSQVRYSLRFRIPSIKTEPVEGSLLLSFQTQNIKDPVILDFKQEPGSVKTLKVNGATIAVKHENEHLIIPSEHLRTGENEVAIDFLAGSNALNRNNDYMYALFVPEKARTAFPCFDQPDMKAVFELTLDIPGGWRAMSNGELLTVSEQKDFVSCRFAPTELISTYLFAFTAGKFESEERVVDGRRMEFFYRETDAAKLRASMDAVFEIHGQSLRFLENYTAVPYPFKKFAFAAIPDFQFGGMEHPGAIWYNASQLFLDSSATRSQLIARANLIAHETAHMWFGDWVTMQWFNDVWMKEVYANFMADKIVGQLMKDETADLKFITAHFPAAYKVDRTEGANPIRQELNNLDQAGSLYGAIIYHKAPIMMQQLEALIGSDTLQQGLRIYLQKFGSGNATWPDLIHILDSVTSHDLKVWNDEWVNKAGRKSIDTFITHIHRNSYGLFRVDTSRSISSVPNSSLRALLYINLFENIIEGRYLSPLQWLNQIKSALQTEKEELISQLLLGQLQQVYWTYLSPQEREQIRPEWESTMRELSEKAGTANARKQFFKTWINIVESPTGVDQLFAIWQQLKAPKDISLNDDDFSGIAAELALKNYPYSDSILAEELRRISNPDKKLRWQFLMPALSSQEKVRDSMFNALLQVNNRQKESWVNSALSYLHHPLRHSSSLKYIRPSLDVLEEIQQTGDIFFPANWLEAVLGRHNSAEAEKIVRTFIEAHPTYNPQLMNKLLQAADPLFRANRLRK